MEYNNRVLFLTQSYPETCKSASTLCTHRVMQEFAVSGEFEVHALCYQLIGEKQNEVVGGIFVHRVCPTLWLRFRNRYLIRNKIIVKIVDTFQKIITIPFYPNLNPFATRKLYSKAQKLYDEYNFALVISENHGLETFIAGCELKERNCSIKHIPIFWDPLKGHSFSPLLPREFSKKRFERLENKAIKFSTLLISMSSMRSFYEVNGDPAKEKRVYLDIPGIIPPDKEVASDYLNVLKDGYINIVYSGILTIPTRDPLPIIKLFNNSSFVEGVNLIFFCAGNAKDVLVKAKDSFKGKISINDYIPLNELHTVYKYSNFLLNISDINANMTPSKIFEYMSYGKPIISFYLTEGDAAKKYLDNYSQSICINLNESDSFNVNMIDAFMSSKHEDLPFEYVKEAFSNNTPECYLRYIKGICQ